MELAHRHVVITGATGGLGAAVVRVLADAGATCHLPTRGHDGAPIPGASVVAGVDLTDERSVGAFYQGLPPLWASVHLAGGFAASAIEETSLQALRAQLDLNLVTAFLCCREAVRRIRRDPHADGARLVNVTSRAAAVPGGGAVAYTAAKAAVGALTASLGEELKGENILVNAVAPSIIDTPANRRAMPEADHTRWPQPEELAQAILWLVSPRNRLTSGAVVPVYGRA